MEKNELIKELLSELSYRSNEGYPILENREHISILAEILDEFGLGSIKNELIENLLEAEPKSKTDDLYKSIGGTGYVLAKDFDKWEKNKDAYTGDKFTKGKDGQYTKQGGDDTADDTPKTGTALGPDSDYAKAERERAERVNDKDDKDDKDDTEVSDASDTPMSDDERNKVLQNTAELFVDTTANKVSGAGRFSLSQDDVKDYKEYLSLTPEERTKRLDDISNKQKQKIGKVTEVDIDTTIKLLKETLGSKEFGKLKSSIKGKGDPPKKYLKGKAENPSPPPAEITKSELRFRNVIKHYLKTGGVSPITGKVVPFHDSQLDHIASLDNGGEDGPENWMWMESRMNQFKGKLTDTQVEAKLIEQGLQTPNELEVDMKEKDFKNWNTAAEVAYWEVNLKKGNMQNLSVEKIKNMNKNQLNNLIKGYNESVGGENSSDGIARYGEKAINVAGIENPITVSRGGYLKPDKNNPKTWGAKVNDKGEISYPDPPLKNIEDGEKLYDKDRASGGRMASRGQLEQAIIDKLGDKLPNTITENKIDTTFEDIQKEKEKRKTDIDRLNKLIKNNPNSSTNSKKQVNSDYKKTDIPKKIKDAIGSGSIKNPENKEAYDMAKKEKSAWILDRWIKEEEKIQRVRLNRKS